MNLKYYDVDLHTFNIERNQLVNVKHHFKAFNHLYNVKHVILILLQHYI
jgi:hypothetical protein